VGPGTFVLLVVLPAGLLAQPSSFDHSAYDALLGKHVVEGMVDYDAFRAPEFKAYLGALARADVDALSEKERLALYINAYNAYTIELINEKGERDSIRNINKTLGLRLKGPWKEELAAVGGKTYALDTLEQDIIRKQFQEPRIHFALVCAAMSCPSLRSEAYTGARLDAQLDDQARGFLLRSPEKNRVDLGTGTLHVSMILDWYKRDFGTTDAAVAGYVAGFYPEGPEKQLLLSGKAKLATTDYDWTLNSQEHARGRPRGSALPSP
jgi:hypothetical protein